ncbi:hypothetical protein [Bacillus zhangzhouensis]|uniref:hypothetical protein n=1 Tax=Bacillus zhangzhouensis TaxID=1178540 RepID=UPI0020C10E5B|nr:hypothetical protein [Bacillus zhangzhouensis]
MEYNSLIKTLDENGGKELILVWENGLKIVGKPDTLYESDNGLEDDDANYTEYYAVAFRVIEVLTHPSHNESSIYDWISTGKSSLVEISLYKEPPNEIYLADGQELWELDSDESQ